MTAAARTSPDTRNRSIAAAHACRRQVAGMGDEDTWRDFLETTTGKRSMRAMSDRQIRSVVEALRGRGARKAPPRRAGGRPLADAATARKARALWISLYHLGCVQDPSERALASFVKRQSGVDDLRFLHEALGVIEALKAWAARPVEDGGGGVSWEPYATWIDGIAGKREVPRARVMEAQWSVLHRFGAVRIKDQGALAGWIAKLVGRPADYTQLAPEESDRAIEALGAKVRRARAAPKGAGKTGKEVAR